jgi:hypothetical protein
VNSISNKRFAERIFGPVGTMDREAVAGMDGHLADLEVLGERQVKAYPRTETDRRTVGKANGRRIIGAFRKTLFGTTFRFV